MVQKVIKGSLEDMVKKQLILLKKKLDVSSDNNRYITNKKLNLELNNDEHIIVSKNKGIAVYNKNDFEKLKKQYIKLNDLQNQLKKKGHNIPEDELVKPPVIFLKKI